MNLEYRASKVHVAMWSHTPWVLLDLKPYGEVHIAQLVLTTSSSSSCPRKSQGPHHRSNSNPRSAYQCVPSRLHAEHIAENSPYSLAELIPPIELWQRSFRLNCSWPECPSTTLHVHVCIGIPIPGKPLAPKPTLNPTPRSVPSRTTQPQHPSLHTASPHARTRRHNHQFQCSQRC